jgi:hypothetical protein
MSQVKDFLSIIETDYHNFEKYFKSFLNNYTRLVNFLERVFSVFPIELLCVFLLGILILYVLNSVSKENRKTNLFVSILLSTVAIYLLVKVGILSKKKQAESLTRVLMSPVLILIPCILYYLILTGIQKAIREYRIRKLANLKSIEDSILNLQESYKQLMIEYYNLAENNYDSSEMHKKIEDIQIISEKIAGLLKYQKLAKEKPLKEVNFTQESKVESAA